MANQINHELAIALRHQVHNALVEDLGDGDLTTGLLPQNRQALALVLVRESGVLCGQPWFDEVFRQLDPEARLQWRCGEGEEMRPNQLVVTVSGPVQTLLSGERTALNFLQTLSGVATITRQFVAAVAGTRAQIVDTRKTIPGLRLAEKYAVRIGGGTNHRLGLYDGVLIKENHIMAAGNVATALARAHERAPPGVFVQVEVESQDELREALDAGARMVLLDNMTPDQLREAVALNQGRAILEASGGVALENVRDIAETGVDRISVGGLTKHLRSVDFSMRLQVDEQDS